MKQETRLIEGKCDCCRKDNLLIQHFDLFVFGSEGIWLCVYCQVVICRDIESRCLENLRQRRDAVLERKQKEMNHEH